MSETQHKLLKWLNEGTAQQNLSKEKLHEFPLNRLQYIYDSVGTLSQSMGGSFDKIYHDIGEELDRRDEIENVTGLNKDLVDEVAKYGHGRSVQSILIPISWNIGEARKWILDNGYQIKKIHKTNHFYRFRQKEPNGGSYATKKLDNGVELIYNNEEQRGGGLLDYIKEGINRIRNVFKGPKEGPNRALRLNLEKVGNDKITSIEVARKPLSSGLKRLGDYLSGGKLSKRLKDLGYDDVYHSYLIVGTEKGDKYKVQKDHVVNMVPATEDDYKYEHKSIPVTKDLNLNTMIKNTEDKIGKNKLFVYSLENQNCQAFMKGMIDSNGLDKDLDYETRQVIKPQDAKYLVDSLDNYSGVPKIATDVASSFDRIFGEGKKRGKGKMTVKRFFETVNGRGLASSKYSHFKSPKDEEKYDKIKKEQEQIQNNMNDLIKDLEEETDKDEKIKILHLINDLKDHYKILNERKRKLKD